MCGIRRHKGRKTFILVKRITVKITENIHYFFRYAYSFNLQTHTRAASGTRGRNTPPPAPPFPDRPARCGRSGRPERPAKRGPRRAAGPDRPKRTNGAAARQGQKAGKARTVEERAETRRRRTDPPQKSVPGIPQRDSRGHDNRGRDSRESRGQDGRGQDGRGQDGRAPTRASRKGRNTDRTGTNPCLSQISAPSVYSERFPNAKPETVAITMTNAT